MVPLTRFALAPLGLVYEAAVCARLGLYRRGALPVQEVGAPVLSVGNITVGGTGKTPLVEWLARAASERENLRACVLTRGYGRAEAWRRVLVSDGEQLLAGVREAGDEPRLLAEQLLRYGAAVVSDADRVAGAQFALERLGSRVFILDDGFQHLRLARDLDVVTIDATDPWGGGRLLPAGRLREPRAGLRRADCVLITRAELAENFDALRAEAARLCEGRPVLAARTRTRGISPLLEANASAGAREAATQKAAEEPAARLGATPRAVSAFCAVGNPRAFFEHARGEGFELRATRTFADHHPYTQADVDGLVCEATRCSAEGLLTTAKDAVKLRGLRFSVPCFVLEIELEIEEEERLFALVRAAVERGAARSRDSYARA